MSKILLIIVSIGLVLHGLIHLMGTTVYMKLGMIEGFGYKTTLLAGRFDLGAGGIAVFGALWVWRRSDLSSPQSRSWRDGSGGSPCWSA